MAKKEKKQSLMSGISPLTAIESVLAFALFGLAVWSLYTVVACKALHQLIIAIPSLIASAVILYQQGRERKQADSHV